MISSAAQFTAPICWPTPRAEEWTMRLPESTPQIQAIVVIGSAARGDLREGSDLDLIVAYSGERPRARPPPEVDVRWVEVSRLESCVQNGDDVVAWGAEYGVPVYDPRHVWEDLVQHWRDRLPLPSPQTCRERADRARSYALGLLGAGDLEAASEQVLTMLTHQARGAIAARGSFPASRGELVNQLRTADVHVLADLLERALNRTLNPHEALQVSNTNLDANSVPSTMTLRR
jgi:predicted nucleotidyltransferase